MRRPAQGVRLWAGLLLCLWCLLGAVVGEVVSTLSEDGLGSVGDRHDDLPGAQVMPHNQPSWVTRWVSVDAEVVALELHTLSARQPARAGRCGERLWVRHGVLLPGSGGRGVRSAWEGRAPCHA